LRDHHHHQHPGAVEPLQDAGAAEPSLLAQMMKVRAIRELQTTEEGASPGGNHNSRQRCARAEGRAVAGGCKEAHWQITGLAKCVKCAKCANENHPRRRASNTISGAKGPSRSRTWPWPSHLAVRLRTQLRSVRVAHESGVRPERQEAGEGRVKLWEITDSEEDVA
jgi:hypothetical protein